MQENEIHGFLDSLLNFLDFQKFVFEVILRMADSVGVKPISEALSLWKPSTQKGSIFSYRPNAGQKDRNFFSLSTNLQIKQQSSLVMSQVTQPIYTKGGALVSLVNITKGLIVDLDV